MINKSIYLLFISCLLFAQDDYEEWLKEKGKKFTEDWMKRFEEENKELIKEIKKLENPFDTKVANALANSNVEMTINKNKM